MNTSTHTRCAGLAAVASLVGFLVLLAGCEHAASAPVAPVRTATKPPSREDELALAHFKQTISPILEQRCYACHGDGEQKGGLALDALTDRAKILENPALWLKVLRNTRSHIMPPPDRTQLTTEERATLEQWIKTAGFGLSADQPDPGRVTVRRLNRTEYRNTVRDLLGVDFDVEQTLLPDDVGYGFDNIGDVLSISPIRMEKFLTAAQAVIDKGVPVNNKALSGQLVMADEFHSEDGQDGQHLSFYQYQEVVHAFQARKAGDYRVIVSSKIDGEAQPVDPQHAKVTWKSDGKEFRQFEYIWNDALYSVDDNIVHWDAGAHKLSFAIEPVYPDLQPLRTKMEYRIIGVTVEGPLDPKDWELPATYHRFYVRDEPPPATDAPGRRAYAREVLEKFATRAYRRPVAADTLDRLVAIAEQVYDLPNTTFEKGVAQAMLAVLASPRFLFHLEEAAPAAPGERFPQVDEYTLASRLSYFLWSSMPDEELFRLATGGQLRKNLAAQVKRMLADPKAQALVENFPGQWLQSRNVLSIPIDAPVVLASERAPVSPVAADTPSPALAGADVPPAGFPGRGGRGRGGPGAFTPPDLAAVGVPPAPAADGVVAANGAALPGPTPDPA
ncbi:MAG: DUF1587 domain-containing protein, partial [Verrucomicrobiota bacterium]